MSTVGSTTGGPANVGVRQWLLAAGTLGTAVTLFASEALDPVGTGTAEHFWTAATASNGRLIASALLLLLSSVLLVPAVAAVMRLARPRGATLALVGAALLVLGAFGHAMLSTLYLLVSTMPADGADPAQMLSLLERFNESPNLAVAFPLIVSFGFGLLVSFVALYRAGVVPVWVLGTVVAAFLLEVVAPGDAGVAVALVKQGLGVVAFGYLAVCLVRPWPSRGGEAQPARARMSEPA